jgi:hypothetical protein
MADLEKRYLTKVERNKRKRQLSPFGIVMLVIIYVLSIGAMVAIVPKNAKWWWEVPFPSNRR